MQLIFGIVVVTFRGWGFVANVINGIRYNVIQNYTLINFSITSLLHIYIYGIYIGDSYKWIYVDNANLYLCCTNSIHMDSYMDIVIQLSFQSHFCHLTVSRYVSLFRLKRSINYYYCCGCCCYYYYVYVGVIIITWFLLFHINSNDQNKWRSTQREQHNCDDKVLRWKNN